MVHTAPGVTLINIPFSFLYTLISRPHPQHAHDELIDMERACRVDKGLLVNRVWLPEQRVHYGTMETDPAKITRAPSIIASQKQQREALRRLDLWFTDMDDPKVVEKYKEDNGLLWQSYMLDREEATAWWNMFLTFSSEDPDHTLSKELQNRLAETGELVFPGGEYMPGWPKVRSCFIIFKLF